MTSLPTSAAVHMSAPAAQRVSVAPAPSGPSPGATVDPLKLLLRYKWVLVASLVVGAVLGAASHEVLVRVYPRWRPFVLFEIVAPQRTVTDIAPAQNTDEMTRFMQTEARIMTSATVFARVSEDPKFRDQAPKWTAQFMELDPSTGQQRFDSVTATRELQDYVTARVVPQTNLVQLSCTYTDRHDATRILSLVREKYNALLRERNQLIREDRTSAVFTQINNIDSEIRNIQTRRETLVRDKNLDTVNNAQSATGEQLRNTQEQLTEISSAISRQGEQLKQMEGERNNPAGPDYGDNIRQETERDPVIVDLRGEVASLESAMQGLLNQGYGRDHRDVLRLQARIDGARQNLETKRLEVLQKLFNGEIDDLRKSVEQLEASRFNLANEQTTLRARLTDLTSAQRTVEDLDRQIENASTTKAKLQGDLQDIQATLNLETANRVIPRELERVPSLPAFPTRKVMIPAGIVIVFVLVAATLFVRELADQRVKGPSDITLIPRMRMVGWVPDGAEDPAGQGNAETAFRDRPRGVVAESFRQLRSVLTKRMQGPDHRTLLVLGSMPGSGTTSVVLNLAFAYAAAEKRVLVIDANFRRPSQHRVLGLQESPGLADVLGGRRDLADAVQATATPNLDLLSAGSKDLRIYERLATQAMSELLTQARAKYDVVLIDVAPAIVAGDGLAISHRCDASILVARAMSDKRGMVARVKNELAESRAEFLGVVVNAVRSSAGGYLKGNIKAASEYEEA
jgi:capsular exopolysaccharide synthesis family protein